MAEAFTISFCGDTSLGYYYLERSRHRYPEARERLRTRPHAFFDGVRPLLRGSDELILNLETVLSHHPGPPIEDKQYPGCDDPDVTVGILRDLGVTAVTLANNHSMDFGPETLLAMIETLRDNGIAVIGAGRNLAEARQPYRIAAVHGDRDRNVYVFSGMRSTRRYAEYGFFATRHRPGVASTNLDALSREIRDIRAADAAAIIIVCPHWQGIDYQDTGNRHRTWCRAIIDAGADHVIAHGTHKADRIETRRHGTIFYSIGNFVFNSPGRYALKQATPHSLVPRLVLDPDTPAGRFRVDRIVTDNKATGFRVHPVEETAQPNPCELDYSSLEKNTYKADRPFALYAILARELHRLGFATRRVAGILEASRGGRSCHFLETETSFTSLVAFRILKDKAGTREVLADRGIHVARGESFAPHEKERARTLVQTLGRAVIKPADGNKGKGVSVNVGAGGFEQAWAAATRRKVKRVLVEEYFAHGKEARYLVIDGACIAVSMRLPPRLRGDGQRTIAELVDAENAARKRNPNLLNRPLEIDEVRQEGLRQQGLELSSVLEPGQVITIDTKANLSTGADSVDITDHVHPSMCRIAEAVSQAIPGLDIVGIDILALDHTAPAEPGNYIVVEANTRPGIGGHHCPTYGPPRNVARLIAESVSRKLDPRADSPAATDGMAPPE